jgi:hypothetical protein
MEMEAGMSIIGFSSLIAATAMAALAAVARRRAARLIPVRVRTR